MNFKFFFQILAFAITISTISNSNIAIASSQKTKILFAAGCKTEYFLIKDLVDEFKKETGKKINLKRANNKIGIKLLKNQKIDFAFCCKPLKKLKKKLKLDDIITKNWATMRIAREPIVIIINKKNSITDLSTNQLKDIFTGKIQNWQEVGGLNMPIKIARLSDSTESGILTVFKEVTLGRKKPGVLNTLTKTAKSFPGPKKIGAFVARNPSAITFMGIVTYQERYGKKIKVNSISPTYDNIINNSYPLTATYHLIYPKDNLERLKPFINFIASDKGIETANRHFVSDLKQ
jgi:phosphate transport system substrate-binding protein